MKFDLEWMTFENDFVEVVLRMTLVLCDLQPIAARKVAASKVQVDVRQREVRCLLK